MSVETIRRRLGERSVCAVESEAVLDQKRDRRAYIIIPTEEVGRLGLQTAFEKYDRLLDLPFECPQLTFMPIQGGYLARFAKRDLALGGIDDNGLSSITLSSVIFANKIGRNQPATGPSCNAPHASVGILIKGPEVECEKRRAIVDTRRRLCCKRYWQDRCSARPNRRARDTHEAQQSNESARWRP